MGGILAEGTAALIRLRLIPGTPSWHLGVPVAGWPSEPWLVRSGDGWRIEAVNGAPEMRVEGDGGGTLVAVYERDELELAVKLAREGENDGL